MSRLTAFLEDSLKALREALLDASARAGLHLHPKTISKALATKLRASLKLAGIMLRRLVLLMALEVELPEPAPPRQHAPQERAPRKPGYRFQLFPAHRYDGAALEALRDRPRPEKPGPVSVIPLRDRHETLMTLLRDPEKLARRMAFRLRALKAAGPVVARILPQRGLYRLDPRLGLIAQAVAERLNEGMRAYFDSG